MVTRVSMIRKVAAITMIIGSCLIWQAAAQDKAGVRVKGSNEWSSSVSGWANRYMSGKPGVSVVVSGGGTKSGIEALFKHEAEIALTSHFLDQDQKKAAADQGLDLQERLVSWDAVAIFVNRENPVNELTLDQVRSVFMGQVTSWKGVGGADAPVELYIDEDPKSDTALLLRKLVLANADFASKANLRRYPKLIVQGVSGNKNGVGYAPLARVIELQSTFPVKLLGIRRAEDTPAVAPTKDSVANQTYPIILPLFFYWDGKSAVKPTGKVVTDFVTFCEEEGRPGGGK
jgi:phosphate transport system substrate-binding protein